MQVWLVDNAVAVTAFAALVGAAATAMLALTTIVYAWHTRTLADENRRLRKASSEPQVVAYLTINPNVFIAFDFVLRNVGRGPAKNVKYEITSGGEDFDVREIYIPRKSLCFAILPQDEEIRLAFGISPKMLKEPPLKSFSVTVTYENFDNEKRSELFQLDIEPYRGIHRLGKSPLEKIAECTKQISDDLRKIARILKKSDSDRRVPTN